MGIGMACNGIDTDALKETMGEIKKDPALAKFVFKARNKWDGGAHCETSIKSFSGAGSEDQPRKQEFVLHADEPAILLGTDQGANATEALLHALASCLSASLIYQASARGVEIKDLQFEMEGELDLRGFLGMSDEVRNGFKEIRIKVHLQANASEEMLEELVQLAQKRSPVFDMVTNPTPVNVTLA